VIPVHVDYQVPYTNNGSERAVVGEVRAINGHLKVYDGSQFIPIHTTAWVDNIELGTVVEWARQKMEQELREAALAERFPAFARAKENYDMIRMLVENEVA
jgi:transcriptional regulator GlxA family with amidase domain